MAIFNPAQKLSQTDQLSILGIKSEIKSEIEQFEKFMKISERDQYLKEHPELQPGLTACAWQEAAFGGRKPDAGFKEVLQKIKERTPGGYKMKSSFV